MTTTKATKQSVDYSRGHRDSHCGPSFDGDKNYCRFYIETALGAESGQCHKVQGNIGRIMWCKLWSKAAK